MRFTFQETAYPADDTVGHGGDSYPFYITVYYSYSEQYGTIPTFGVTQSGAIYASSGLIGGWKLGDTMLAGKDDGTEISLSPGGIFIKSSKY